MGSNMCYEKNLRIQSLLNICVIVHLDWFAILWTVHVYEVLIKCELFHAT